MRYLSVCSGIEAVTLAWQPLGWHAVGFSEVDEFPRAVLQYHYPDIPLYGDFTKIQGSEPELGAVDLLVGGTPCQSFSKGARANVSRKHIKKGLHDHRGSLAIEFIRLAKRANPRWIVWENVTGALSANGGRDFGAILGEMENCGYGWAYRVLDSQWFGTPQRRRRVFLVGCNKGMECAASVLFEPDCLRWNPRKRRKKREDIESLDQASTTKGDGGFIVGVDCYAFYVALDGTAYTLSTQTGHYTSLALVGKGDWCSIRKFTPEEYELLMGFPVGFTAIPFKNKPVARDSLRYKALGNSMVVPVMKWIGQRIQLVDSQIP